MDSLRADFESGGEYSDMTLACGERTWKVHSIVICPQSKRIGEEYRKLKMSGEQIKIALKAESPEIVLGAIQYCYSGKYPKASGSEGWSFAASHAGFWHFAREYKMPKLGSIAREQFEDTGSKEIGTEKFAQVLELALSSFPYARESCLNIIEKRAEEVFEGSQKYDALCKVIKTDSQFLFELTARMARSQKERAEMRSGKRASSEQEAEEANKRRKLAGGESSKGIENTQVADRKLLNQVAALQPHDVQCCKPDESENKSLERPAAALSSSAQNLLKANGFITFHCPDCRTHFDAKIKLQEKFRHKCRNRFEGKGTEHTGAVWHAFFRSGNSTTLIAERQFWMLLERMQKTLNDGHLQRISK